MLDARQEPIMQAFAIAAAGVAHATERFAASAARTARDPLADLAGEAVERIGAETALKANVAVLKTADEMAGTLLDILA
jgi:flagellar hook protein FlgE